MRFSANPFCLFPDLTLADACKRLRALGYGTIEMWALSGEALEGVRRQVTTHGMRLSAFCPDFFTLNDRSAHGQYEDSLGRALALAGELRAPALITQVGQDNGLAPEVQHQNIVAGLKRVAPQLEAADITLLVEPLNDVKDHPGYALCDPMEAFQIIREVDSPRVRLLYDVYHMLHMGQDVEGQIKGNLDLIAHLHIAGFPDRDERLWTGFPYQGLFNLLEELKVTFPIGLEFFPESREAAEQALTQLAAWRTGIS